MRLNKYITFVMVGYILLFILTISAQTAEQNINPAGLKSTNRPWNVKENILPRIADDRDRYLQEADAKIRKGLYKLSEKYKQLSEARYWNDIISGKSNTGQIDIVLFHTDSGKAKSSQRSIPKNEQFSVLVVIQTPPKEIPQMSMSNLYPNLGLVGQVNTTAGNPKLQAELKKLIDESLKPIEKLELEQKKLEDKNLLTYTDEKRHFRFQYPKDWKIAAGPRIMLHHEQLVAMNNLGKENYWIKDKPVKGGFISSPETVADFLPAGCIYFTVERVEFSPPPWSPGMVEMESNNLSEMLAKSSEQPAGDKRLTSQGVYFYKWGKWWSVNVIFRQPVKPIDRVKANRILESFRFFGVPAGDEAWAINEAHKQLPAEVRPGFYFNAQGGVYKSTRAAKDGNDVVVTFTKADPNNLESKRIWQFKVTAAGEVIRILTPDTQSPNQKESAAILPNENER